ncbi:MAG: hypothetical protein IJY42_00480 [Clostridia bacterium]|nr:hypothetical protein [Clostridia bacterium]
MGKKMQNIEHPIPVSLSSHNMGAEVSEFCDCINENRDSSIGAAEGTVTVAVCEAIIRSSETGKPETISY